MNSELLLPIAFAFPLLCALGILITGKNEGTVKLIAGAGFGVPFLISLYTFWNFESAENGYAFLSDPINTGLASFGIHFQMGLNGISSPLFLLAGVVGLAAGIAAIHSGAKRLHLYLFLLLVMHSGLMGVFASVDIFFFYFFHELALIPTFIMVGIWGSHERQVAAMEMTIYLTLGALISLLGIVGLYLASGDGGTLSMIELKDHLAKNPIGKENQEIIFGLLLFGLGILVSLFPTYSWAPRGYGAAPTSTAMLHAGVLKKFGIYGLIQVAAPMLPLGAAAWSDGLVILALCNIVLIGFVVMAQEDLKQMIGYGSVMHMGYCFLGLATLSVIGVGGAVMLMVAHGMSVALLFLLSTYIHRRTKLLDMVQLGGLASKTPVLAVCFVAATMASIGLPGFGNFLGEFSIFHALWMDSGWKVAIAATGILISAIYGLRAVSRVFFGEASQRIQDHWKEEPPKDLNTAERLPAFLLLGFMLLIGMKPMVISEGINQHVKSLNYEDVQPDSENLLKAQNADIPQTSSPAKKDTHHH
jgi:NADH-quinone oxidoreductase subunit M